MGIESARSSTSLVVRCQCTLIFFRKKPPSKSTSMRTQRRKDPTQRRGQRDSHRSSYWTRATTFSLRKIAVTNLPVNSPFFLTTFHNSPRFVHRFNFKVNRRSRVSETPILRIVALHFLIEKNIFLWIYNVRLTKTRFEIFSKIVTVGKRSNPALLVALSCIQFFLIFLFEGDLQKYST